MARGRKPLFSNSFSIVEALRSVQAGDYTKVSDWHRVQLMELGLIEKYNLPNEGRRGRPRVAFRPTGKARSLIALSRNWKRSA